MCSAKIIYKVLINLLVLSKCCKTASVCFEIVSYKLILRGFTRSKVA